MNSRIRRQRQNLPRKRVALFSLPLFTLLLWQWGVIYMTLPSFTSFSTLLFKHLLICLPNINRKYLKSEIKIFESLVNIHNGMLLTWFWRVFYKFSLCPFIIINVTDGMFCMNGTTSVPMSVLRYTVDKVRQVSGSEVCYSNASYVQN